MKFEVRDLRMIREAIGSKDSFKVLTGTLSLKQMLLTSKGKIFVTRYTLYRI